MATSSMPLRPLALTPDADEGAGAIREGVALPTPRNVTQVGMAIDSLLPENYREVVVEIETLTTRLRVLLGQKSELEVLASIRGIPLP